MPNNQIQKLLAGCPDFPSVRDIAEEKEPEVFLPRTKEEDERRAYLPGEDVTQHPLYVPPNPYLYEKPSRLLELLKQGHKDSGLIRAALEMIRRS